MGIAANIGRSWLIGVEIRGMELNSYWLKNVLFSLFFFVKKVNVKAHKKTLLHARCNC